MRIIFCKNWKTDFFSNFFQDFQYSSVFLVFFGRFRDSILKKFHIEKKIPKEKIQVFSIFTGFWCFFGTFSISGLLKIWVIPFNSIEYWKCSIPKFQYYWIPKKIPVLKFNNTEKKNQYFSPPYFWCLRFPPKNEQRNLTLLLWYLKLTCFHSFFGGNRRHQNTISKLSDL